MTFHGLGLGAFTLQGTYALLLLVVWFVFFFGPALGSPIGALICPEFFACWDIWYVLHLLVVSSDRQRNIGRQVDERGRAYSGELGAVSQAPKEHRGLERVSGVQFAAAQKAAEAKEE